MGIIDEMKKSAKQSGAIIQDTDSATIQAKLNRLFLAEKNIEEETKFVKAVMTRGFETTERLGLHASDMIGADKAVFCVRRRVLSLMYRQNGDEDLPINVKRIFEEGNAIHEKWQRLFIRGKLTDAKHCDVTKWYDDFMLSYTPDIICEIKPYGKMICEIKSQNTYLFQKGQEHVPAKKQLNWYMFLSGIKQGFVLVEDKNNQDFRIHYYKYDHEIVAPFIERAEKIMFYYERVMNEKKMIKRDASCTSPACKVAMACPMKDACYDVGRGRSSINHQQGDRG